MTIWYLYLKKFFDGIRREKNKNFFYNSYRTKTFYKVCLKRISLVRCHWYNFATNQRGPHGTCMRLLSWQKNIMELVLILCDCHIHNNWANRSVKSHAIFFFGIALQYSDLPTFWVVSRFGSLKFLPPLKGRRFQTVHEIKENAVS